MATSWLSKTLVPSGVVEHVVCGRFVAAQAGQAQVVLVHAGSNLELLAVGASGTAASICSQPLQAGEAVVDARALRGGSDPGGTASVSTTTGLAGPRAADISRGTTPRGANRPYRCYLPSDP
jgi:hypothetical protein